MFAPFHRTLKASLLCLGALVAVQFAAPAPRPVRWQVAQSREELRQGQITEPPPAPILPDPALTPGDTLPVGPSDICTSGYTAKVRDVPLSVRKGVFAAYGIPYENHKAYELDHLISLELGGSNSARNLWPEAYAGQRGARVKDQLENRLHSLVCAGKMTLPTAQKAISSDWALAYAQYVEDDAP